MTRLISVLALVLATGAAAADYPAPLPVPVPLPPGRPYSLPHGYFSSGGWAVPSAGAAYAVPKAPDGSCAWGWLSSGSFCLRSGR